MANQYTMQDPRTQYPQPDFSKQPQSAPGLASEMDPKPDHGEATYEGKGRLEGRKALITGADSGIGRATAIAYAREGASVALAYLDEENADAQEVVELLKGEGANVFTFTGDVKDEAYCTQLVKDAADAMGGLDIIVSNAGKQTAIDSLADLTTDNFDATYKTNVYAPFWIIKEGINHLKPGSSFIITSSVQAYNPSPNLVDYASTKAAERAMVQALAGQLIESHGIRVNGVAPGPVWTPLQSSGGQPQDKIEKFGEEVPYNRPGQPAELAPVYVFLASGESSYVAGQIYGVTGGMPTA